MLGITIIPSPDNSHAQSLIPARRTRTATATPASPASPPSRLSAEGISLRLEFLAVYPFEFRLDEAVTVDAITFFFVVRVESDAGKHGLITHVAPCGGEG
jgi:hypothetical protein